MSDQYTDADAAAFHKECADKFINEFDKDLTKALGFRSPAVVRQGLEFDPEYNVVRFVVTLLDTDGCEAELALHKLALQIMNDQDAVRDFIAKLLRRDVSDLEERFKRVGFY